MAGAEGHADRAGNRGHQLPSSEGRCSRVRISTRFCEPKFTDRDHAAFRLDAAGVAADAAFTLRGNRLQQFAGAVENQELVRCWHCLTP